jgi:hypothetical protein
LLRVEDPVFAMAESFFLDGGSRLDHVEQKSLTEVSEERPVALLNATSPDVGRCRCAGEANGVAESFNGKFRDECLSLEFRTRAEAKVIIESWRQHYNAVRPHSSLGYLTPNEFAARQTKNPSTSRQATGRVLRYLGPPRPVAPPAQLGHMLQTGAVSS